jgi:energy-converting hydrogenase Eha subunit E
MIFQRLREIYKEIEVLLTQQSSLVDSIVPPILFVIANELFGFDAAMWTALIVAVVIGLVRIVRGQSVWYAAGGALTVLGTIGLVLLFGEDEAFFIPGILTTALTVLGGVISLIARRPMLAWMSFIARRWPQKWYWRDDVRPAYMETTFVWTLYFVAKLWVQARAYQAGDTDALAWLALILGTPGVLTLLVFTYVYGTWRLRKMAGPSVQEFKDDAPPPWKSQRSGF